MLSHFTLKIIKSLVDTVDRLVSKSNTWMKLNASDRAKSMTKLLNLLDDLLFDNLIQRIDNYQVDPHPTTSSSSLSRDVDFQIQKENICKHFIHCLIF